jgi:hypothetical protein
VEDIMAKRKSQRQIELEEMMAAAIEEREYNRLQEMDKAEADFYRNEPKLTGLAEHERDSQVSSTMECSQEDARLAGRTRSNQAWILSDFDVWHRNPYYVGPAQPHPEDYGV